MKVRKANLAKKHADMATAEVAITRVLDYLEKLEDAIDVLIGLAPNKKIKNALKDYRDRVGGLIFFFQMYKLLYINKKIGK